MPRKKKETPKEESGFELNQIIGSDAKRSIAAVFLFTLTLLVLLSFFQSAGILGRALDSAFGTLLGWGKWFLPAILLIGGLLFLRRRGTSLADLVKFLGLVLVFFSALGLIHLFTGDTPEALLAVAQSGGGGGFVGYALAYILASFTGRIAGTIILLALLSGGIIAAFNVSLLGYLDRLRAYLQARKEERSLATENDEAAPAQESVETATEAAPALLTASPAPSVAVQTSDLAANNIGSVKFPGEEAPALEEAEEDAGEEDFAVVGKIRAKRRRRAYAWQLPPVDLLESTSGTAQSGDTDRNKQIIQNTLKYFGIEVEPGEVRVGPTVTQYTFRPAFGVKLSRITTLSNDLALALAANSIRIEAPIPGQSLVGIEVPNKTGTMVRLRALIEGRNFKERKSNLMLVLGQDVRGDTIIADLRKMPHLLIAGRTGSGKSVCINTLLLSLLYQNSPEDLKLILVDPKRVEMAAYKGIPHLRTDVVTDNKKVVNVLKWAVSEMERRYKILEDVHAKDLLSYHKLYLEGIKKTVVDKETSQVRQEALENLPTIIIVIDEMADLMVAHGKEVEQVIIRLAQMSRAIGIHLILATQRPSVEVITGLIKANVPTRVAFQVTTQIDSRTILDTGGAEKLLGNGDMLYSASEGGEMKRLQGVYVSDDEVKRVTAFLRKQKEELGEDEIGDDVGDGAQEGRPDEFAASPEGAGGSADDDLYDRAKDIVISTGRASTTYLQTALGVGYPRGARLMHLLEQNGVVGMVDGKKKVLIAKESPVKDREPEEEKYQDAHVSEQQERDKWQL